MRRRLAPTLVVAAGALVVWYALAHLLVLLDDPLATSKLPYPHLVAHRFVAYPETLLEATWASLSRALMGFAIGTAIGMLLCLLMLRAGWIETSVMPYLLLAQMIPLIALVPLIRAIVKNDDATRLLMAAFVTFFTVTIAALRGLKATDRNALELMRSLNASWFTTVRRLRFPASLPYLFAGLKIAAPLSLVGAIVVDLMGARTGLGFLMLSALTFGPQQATMLWAAMVITLAVGWGLSRLVVLVERKVSPWQPAFRQERPR